jgi:hypothetical protein
MKQPDPKKSLPKVDRKSTQQKGPDNQKAGNKLQEKGKGKDDDMVANGSEEEYDDEEFEEEEEYEYDEEEEPEDDLNKDTKFKQAGPNAKKDIEDSIDKLVRESKGKKGGNTEAIEIGKLDEKNKMVKDPLKKTREDHPLKDAAGYKQQSHKDLTRLRNEQLVRKNLIRDLCVKYAYDVKAVKQMHAL